MEESNNNLIQHLASKSPKYSRLLTNERIVERVGCKRLCDFIERTYEMDRLREIKVKQHQLDSRMKNSEYQKEFIEIMRLAYGDHAVKILEERPNLTFINIPDTRIFEPVIYETFGEQFINQLLNFDYDEMTSRSMPYDAIIQSIIDNEDDLNALNFCWNIISAQNGADVYNCARLFYAFSRNYDLIKDCSQNIDNLTLEHYELLKDIIVQKSTLVPVTSIRELETYNERVSEAYNDYDTARSPIALKELILARFFGLQLDSYRDSGFTRTNRDARDLIKLYGFQKIIAYEEKLIAEGKEPHFTDAELKAIRLCEAITKYSSDTKTNEEKVETLQIIYKGIV